MSGLRVLDGVNGTFELIVPNGSYEIEQYQSIEGADISTHTTGDAVFFRVQPTRARSGLLLPDDQGQSASG